MFLEHIPSITTALFYNGEEEWVSPSLGGGVRGEGMFTLYCTLITTCTKSLLMLNLVIKTIRGVMEQTNEEIVTKILSNSEILKRQDAPEVFESKRSYSTNPNYDLSLYMREEQIRRNCVKSKYLFVK